MTGFQTINEAQPAASSQQPAASSQQPAASSQRPAASSQRPAASGQRPAASGHKYTIMRVVAISIALLLLTTASLKLFGFNSTSLTVSQLWSDSRIRLITILWEAILGIWLIVNVRPSASWVASVFTFILFAAVSASLGFSGAATCGCLGAVKANPWWIFGLDILVLAFLAVYRPAWSGLCADFGSIRWLSILYPATCGVLIIIALLASLVARYGSFEAAAADARNERVFARNVVIDFGKERPGKSLESVIEIVNYSKNEVRIFGGTTGCGYDVLHNCPMNIPSGSVGRLHATVIVPKQAGIYNHEVSIWISGLTDSTHPIAVTLTGRSMGE